MDIPQSLNPDSGVEVGEPVDIITAGVKLPGLLQVNPARRGCVVFVHGTGSGQHSPRNLKVAAKLAEHGFSTLLFDLLTPHEDPPDHSARFDIDRLTQRVRGALEWLKHQASVADLPMGLYGASTGAAAALRASLAGDIACVVSRGGRPDLAGRQTLSQVPCPTLLIVGSRDDLVLALNQRSLVEMHCVKQLLTIPGATHLFEEPGTLDEVTQAALLWFSKYLLTPAKTRRRSPAENPDGH